MTEKLSVIIPVFNAERYLDECIKSILNQTYTNIEIICVNDGSTDRSGEIINKYISKGYPIKQIRKENGGVSSARNVGIEEASSDYLAFVDADDYLEKDYFKEIMVNADKFDMVLTGYSIIDMLNNSRVSYTCTPFDGPIKVFVEQLKYYLTPPLLLSPCFKIYKKDILRKNKISFPESLSYGEDAIFTLDYLQYIHNVKCINGSGYCYRKHGNTTLSSRFREDKIDIEAHICDKIDFLMCKYDIINSHIGKKRMCKVFVQYVHEVNKTDMKYSEQKALLFSKYANLNMKQCFQYIHHKTCVELLVSFCLRFKFFFPLYFAFHMRDKCRKLF